MKKLLAVILTLILALGVTLPTVLTAGAVIDPPGANANSLVLSIGRDPGPYYVGETIEYTVYVTVPPWTDGFRPATVTDITVQFQSPDLVVCILDTSLTLTPGSTETYLPADYPCLNYVVRAQDVQPITMGVVAYGNASGTSWVSDDGDPAYDERQITTTVIQPDTDVSIAPSARMIYCGDPVDLTICEENTGDDPLTNVSVELSEDSVIVDTLVAPPDSGDFAPLGQLDPGETWCWTVTDYPADDVTFDAIGHGTDSAGNDVTIPDYPGEYAEVPVEVICPDTEVSISASAEMIYCGDPVDLTICEENTDDDPLTNVSVELSEDSVIVDILVAPPDSGDLAPLGQLDPGETWCWTVTRIPADDVTFDAIGHGTDSAGNDVTIPDHPGEYAEVPVEVICPDTEVSISASAAQICEGDSVDVTFCEENTDDDPLTNVYVVLSPYGWTFDETSTEFTGTDVGGDGILSPGEVWCWLVTDTPADDIVYDVTGHGIDSLGNDVTYPPNESEYAEVPVTVEPCGMEGCTPGFWKNHPACWEGYSPSQTVSSVFSIPSCLSSCNLGGKTLMQALNFGGGSGNCGAAQILLRASVAALLNAADGDIAYPMDVGEVISAVNAALASCNRTCILALATELDMYNNYGCPIDAHCVPCNGM